MKLIVTAPRRRYNRPMPSDSRVDLWYVRLDDLADPGLWQEYLDLLPSDERWRAERFSHEGSRQQFLAARAPCAQCWPNMRAPIPVHFGSSVTRMASPPWANRAGSFTGTVPVFATEMTSP